MPGLLLPALVKALPLDGAVRIEPCEGAPIFCATPRVQERIEDLLAKQTEGPLDESEVRELEAFEELDELLSLVNRLVRNAMHPGSYLSLVHPKTDMLPEEGAGT